MKKMSAGQSVLGDKIENIELQFEERTELLRSEIEKLGKPEPKTETIE